jgi:arylsulfatase A-like enzyme
MATVTQPGCNTTRLVICGLKLERGRSRIQACLAGFGLALLLTACSGSGDTTTATTNSAPTGSVTIVGTPVVGSTLSASQTLADADGLGTLQYQWSRGTTAITGATSATYEVSQADVGATLSVTIGYTDGNGNAETLSSTATAQVTAPLLATQPNILLIIADDLGVDSSNQYSYSADKPRTPTLDALAASGMVFDNVWATPACTTSRAAMITGQHGVHSGVSFVPAVMNTAADTLQRHLVADGATSAYKTAVIGKWHLGGGNPAPSHPTDSGVGYFAGNMGADLPSYTSWPLVENGVSSTSTVYHTSKVTDLTRDWIAAQTQPWFAWLAYAAPHLPFHLPPASLQSRAGLTGTTADIAARPREYYLAAIEAMDTEIGRLLSSMDATARANTVVIFVGDNGTPTQTVDTRVFSKAHSKNTLYEGGVRVPMIVSGKGVARSNVRETALINLVDLYATINSLAGSAATSVYDSKSFASLLQTGASGPRTYNYSEFESTDVSGWVVRDAQYKLIQNLSGTQELYDLSKDLGELTNLLAGTTDYTTTVGALKTQGDIVRGPTGSVLGATLRK